MSKASPRRAAAVPAVRAQLGSTRPAGRRPPPGPPDRPAARGARRRSSVTTSALPPTAVTTGGTPRAIASSEADRQALVPGAQREHVGAGDAPRAGRRGSRASRTGRRARGRRARRAALPRADPARSTRTAAAARRRSPRRGRREQRRVVLVGPEVGDGGHDHVVVGPALRGAGRGPLAPVGPASAPTGTPCTSTSVLARHGRHVDATTSSDTAQRTRSSGSVSALASRVDGAVRAPHVVLGRHQRPGRAASCAATGRATAATAGRVEVHDVEPRAPGGAAAPASGGRPCPRGPASRCVGHAERLQLGHEVLLPVEQVRHLVRAPPSGRRRRPSTRAGARPRRDRAP